MCWWVRSFFLVALFSTALHSYSQSLELRDRFTLLPIDGAVLKGSRTIAFSTSNVKGEIECNAFKGMDSLTITHLAYETVVISYAQLAGMNEPLIPSDTITSPLAVRMIRRFPSR